MAKSKQTDISELKDLVGMRIVSVDTIVGGITLGVQPVKKGPTPAHGFVNILIVSKDGGGLIIEQEQTVDVVEKKKVTKSIA